MREYDPTPCHERRRCDAAHMTTAVVLLSYWDGTLKAVMNEGASERFPDHLVLPTSYVRFDQRVDQAVRDLLYHEVKMGDIDVEHFQTFSCPDRDSEARTMCCAYVGAASAEDLEFTAMINDRTVVDVAIDELGEAQLSIGGMPVRTVLDHSEIIAGAVLHLRRHLASSNLPWRMLEELFTLNDVQQIHEAILGHRLTTAFFRKSVVKRTLPDGGRLVPHGQATRGGAHRPARLYYIDRGKQQW